MSPPPVTQLSGSFVIDNTNILVAQSGGPTAVINASLAGVIDAARQSGTFGRVLGAWRSVEGILSARFIDLTDLSAERLERLRTTPSAALGTSRHRPTDAEIERILTVFERENIDVFVPIGGNDTADTALRLAQAAEARGQALRVVAVPKTIDNDLPETDHCPGYGSIARFIAEATRDAAFDTRAMAHIYPIKLIEVMGRNAGWLAAAGSLAFDANPDLPRPVICLPERPLANLDTLTALVQQRLTTDGYIVMVVPETMTWADGRSVAGDVPVWTDPFGHRYFPSTGEALARELGAKLGVRARYDKPGTIARMSMLTASPVDLEEAFACGTEAVCRALLGETGTMVTIERVADAPYAVRYNSAPLERIANIERLLSDEYIAANEHDVSPEFSAYAMPLLGVSFALYEVLD